MALGHINTMNEIFQIVYEFLKWTSLISGLTYREVNIIVYFIIIPAIFIFILSKIFKEKLLILVFLITVILTIIIVPDFEKFSNDLFKKSVDFLNWFEYFGLNYIQASVLICVIIPILIIFSLLYFKKKKSI